MGHAWLDSLSEDWVSQPASDASQEQEHERSPSLSSSRANLSHRSAREPLSRIPRFNPSPGNNVARKLQLSARNSAHNTSAITTATSPAPTTAPPPLASSSPAGALNERSLNDINIQGAQQRGPAKPPRENRFLQRGRYLSRSASSASTVASVLHDTVQHNKAPSSSPSKAREHVPEWKRRLVYGELNYGESKDLFSSAGTGLENIFRPPMAQESTADDTVDHEEVTANDSTLPSSPPPYSRPVHRESERDENPPDQPASKFQLRRRTYPSSSKQATFRRTKSDPQEPSRREQPQPRQMSDGPREGRARAANSESSEKKEPAVASAHSYLGDHLEAPSRKVSGQSDARNEGLSPILLSCRDSGDGKMSFAPVELPAEQLRKRLEKLRRNQLLLDYEFDSYLEQESAGAAEGPRAADSTDEFAKNSGFLNVQRGGRSREGSFRQRPLSPPPPPNDMSEMLPESSLQASTPKQFPTVRIDRVASADRKSTPGSSASPAVPRAPYPSPAKPLQPLQPLRPSQPPSGQSGSPLKLFGPYDTFTNQTLLRRISQFEDQMTDSPSRSMAGDASPLPTQGLPTKAGANKAPATGSSPRKTFPPNGDDTLSFGAGELDGYEFNEDITLTSCDQSQCTDKENVAPADDSIPLSRLRFQIDQDLSREGSPLVVQRRRHRPPSSFLSPRRGIGLSRPSGSFKAPHFLHLNPRGNQATPRRDGSEGKRPRTSPSKDPTPKRRRTLHRSDIAYGLEDTPAAAHSMRSSRESIQSIMSQMQQESYQDEWYQAPRHSLLATRQILRPRSPTPGQRSSAARDRQLSANVGVDTVYQNGISEPAQEPETFIRDFPNDGSGRTSMKTQDFFDAAEEIMAMIRSKARPRNDLSSVQESEAETTEKRSSAAPAGDESSLQDSTKEPFSRPPSRDGPPLARVPTHQADPDLLSRLKKYEERSDLSEIITNSMQSMGRIRKAINEANSLTESLQQSVLSQKSWHGIADNQGMVSDLPNIRISRNPNPGGNEAGLPWNGVRSVGLSTAHSVPTSSSQRSGSGGFIVPDAVSQLIGDQVGNMVFDKAHNIWRKLKKPKSTPDDKNILPSEDSEDPFASIPDLSVDMTRETQHLGKTPKEDQEGVEQLPREATPSGSSADSSTVTQESFAARSSTSHTKETLKRAERTVEIAVEDDREIEHEITIHEDRLQKSNPSRKRNLTISFSSPIASVIQDVSHHQSDDDHTGQISDTTDQSVENMSPEPLKLGRNPKSAKPSSSSGAGPGSRSRSQGLPRNVSAKAQHEFVPRPVSRIDEQDEDETKENSASEDRQISVRGDSSLSYAEAGDDRNTSLSVVVTPTSAKNAPVSATPIIGQYVGTLSLSHLSEFTMNQADQSCGLEVSYVVGDRYLATGDGSKKIMSKAIQCLVEKITEIEPFEPDWESMRELDISGKQLRTLHMLDEFCTSVITLDASNNVIEHLDGIPESVRNLRVTHNHLSELTAWGHLMNLQYVDVSNNQIISLHAFKDLVHLRSLRADNNLITSLDGIKLHDSLQVLRARGNLFSEVDLDGTKLQRLAELDLENNQITTVRGIEQLSSLVNLNLQHNRLSYFTLSSNASASNLKYLAVSGNNLASLDLAPFPSLRLLHADRNRLTTIKGFSRCRRLDSLSLREQRSGGQPLDTSFLDAAYEIRKLFLSGNLLAGPGFNPAVDFLNLQYLELANCGLRRLPPGLGQLVPNLRALNLNMNAIDDLSALRYIPRLKKLLAAGNRLADAGQVADVLAGFPHLSRLDFRDNPATLGFYAPIQTLVPVDYSDDDGAGHFRDSRSSRGSGSGRGSRGSGVGRSERNSSGDRSFDPFVLPDADPERDGKFTSRSDMGTRMRRRFYEMVVLDRCRRLRTLDGLPVVGDGGSTGRGGSRDKVWRALVRNGVIEVGRGVGEEEEEEGDGGGQEELDDRRKSRNRRNKSKSKSKSKSRSRGRQVRGDESDASSR
ncbi:hypothetical protein GGS23DRAFT_333888 [Durotheca rogersii]|uniref:uncharacterized protein n=1 Tax=Durotheca rogersii TaxID=419775 RepID=UPI00221EB669|nr:uncharacterized protein GGS23DRAFT_333888 [Durotheca rogersii]KAI5858293.1 hypothetical protein GGS23DRAFT_333888 [Durotheca rogersii]